MIIAEEGWRAVTALRLCELAGVDRTVFRQLFGRRGIGRIECARAAFVEAGIDAFASAPTRGGDCLEQGFVAFMRAFRDAERYKRRADPCYHEVLQRDELAIRAAFADALPHGPEAPRDQALSARFEEALAAKLAVHEDGSGVPRAISRALAGGIERAVRRRLAGGEPLTDELAEDLCAWVQCYRHPAAAHLAQIPSDPRSRPIPSFAPSSLRARICEAAARIATSRGPAGLSLAEIARTADVELETVERMYRSSEECFFQAVSRRGLYALVCSVSAAQNVPDALAGIANAVEALLAAIANDPVLARLMFLELSAFRDGVKQREQLIAQFTSRLRRALPAEASPPAAVSDLTADAMWALVDSHVRRGQTAALPEAAPLALYLVLAPAVGAGDAAEIIAARRCA